MLIEHAKKELALLGYPPLSQEQEDGPNRWIQENLLELITVFSKQGHSGSSAAYCVRLLTKLLKFDILSPLTGADSEWVVVGDGFLQNNRLTGVFKSEGRPPHYIDAICFVRDGNEYTGGAFLKDGRYISSSQNIRLPFMPKTFFVDVEQIDDRSYIKDESQLDAVKDYYDFSEFPC